jgi:hypothetical protein
MWTILISQFYFQMKILPKCLFLNYVCTGILFIFYDMFCLCFDSLWMHNIEKKIEKEKEKGKKEANDPTGPAH